MFLNFFITASLGFLLLSLTVKVHLALQPGKRGSTQPRSREGNREMKTEKMKKENTAVTVIVSSLLKKGTLFKFIKLLVPKKEKLF